MNWNSLDWKSLVRKSITGDREEKESQISVGKKYDVYLSYEKVDEKFAFYLKSELEKAGVSAFVANKAETAKDWAEQLASAINGCEYFVALVTDGYMNSREVLREIMYAITAGESVLPIKCTSAPFNAQLMYLFATAQNYTYNPDDGIEVLVEYIKSAVFEKNRRKNLYNKLAEFSRAGNDNKIAETICDIIELLLADFSKNSMDELLKLYEKLSEFAGAYDNETKQLAHRIIKVLGKTSEILEKTIDENSSIKNISRAVRILYYEREIRCECVDIITSGDVHDPYPMEKYVEHQKKYVDAFRKKKYTANGASRSFVNETENYIFENIILDTNKKNALKNIAKSGVIGAVAAASMMGVGGHNDNEGEKNGEEQKHKPDLGKAIGLKIPEIPVRPEPDKKETLHIPGLRTPVMPASSSAKLGAKPQSDTTDTKGTTDKKGVTDKKGKKTPIFMKEIPPVLSACPDSGDDYTINPDIKKTAFPEEEEIDVFGYNELIKKSEEKAKKKEKIIASGKLSEEDKTLHAVADFMREGNKLFELLKEKGAAGDFLKCLLTSYERLRNYCSVVGASKVEAECIEKIFEIKDELERTKPSEVKPDEKLENGIKSLLGFKVRNVGNYDVFISFKSEDMYAAEKIYDYFHENMLQPFFSPKSLPELSEADYEDAIMEALDKSRHFVVVLSKLEYMEANWVKREMRTFNSEIEEGRKDGANFVFVVSDDVYDEIIGSNKKILPIHYRKWQIIRMSEFRKTLLDYIK